MSRIIEEFTLLRGGQDFRCSFGSDNFFPSEGGSASGRSTKSGYRHLSLPRLLRTISQEYALLPAPVFEAVVVFLLVQQDTHADLIDIFGWKAGIYERRRWDNPSYLCYKGINGYACVVVVNMREYQTDLTYESDYLAHKNAAIRAYMVVRQFSIDGGMLARNGVVQGLSVQGNHAKML